MSVLRYLRSKIPTAHHEARTRDKEEFFKFQLTGSHGFPEKPTCIDHDPVLNLLAIGTATGALSLYGAGGVCLEGRTDKGLERVLWLPGQGRLLTQLSDQSFALWEINDKDGISVLSLVSRVTTEDRLKKISAVALRKTVGEEGSSSYTLLIGTESGNVYALDTPSLTLTDYVIYQDAVNVIPNLPDDYRLEAGSVSAMAVQPGDENRILIGFARGLVVLWDAATNAALHVYLAQPGLRALCWSLDGSRFHSTHADGSYVIWLAADASKPMQSPNIPFGPFPCLDIESIALCSQAGGNEEIVVFTGGMPKSTYGDRNAVTIEQGSRQVVLDFSSSVLGFQPIRTGEATVEALAVLCEEELVMVDLVSEGWPQYRLPYLLPIHASPITAAQHVADASPELVGTLRKAGESQSYGRGDPRPFSARAWPITGGSSAPATGADRDLLITGHEDGSVKIWSMASGCMSLLLVVNTAPLFIDPNAEQNARNKENVEWPPFQEVGWFDPYSDDPRFGIQRVFLDGATGLLTIGATGGQVSVWTPSEEETEVVGVESHNVAIVAEDSPFRWKGEPALDPQTANLKFPPGFSLKSVVQLSPPAAVTALAAQPTWGLIGIGTGYGFALFDYLRNQTVHTECLINPDDVAAVEQTTGRWKSMKKSIRQSFRQVNRRARRRQEAAAAAQEAAAEAPKAEEEEASPAPEAEAGTATAAETETGTAPAPPASPPPKSEPTASPRKSPKRVTMAATTRRTPEPEDMKPVERAIVARADSPAGPGEQMTSLVRSLVFADTHVLNPTTTTPTFWVGTNGGAVKIHTLEVPEKREEEDVKCNLAKEIQLQHRAPVLGMFIVDGADFPLGGAPENAKPSEEGHRVIICSEEQVKSFSLPGLKPGRSKFKMTAIEGSLVRKVTCATLPSQTDSSKWEAFLIVMTNHGDVEAFSCHSARRYLKAGCIASTDVRNVNSTVLSQRGEGLYLSATSEWRCFVAGAAGTLRPACTIALPDGARPPLPAQSEEAAPADDAQPDEEETGAGLADLTLASGDAANTTANSSLPTDVTLDSIRDYTVPPAPSSPEHMETVAETEVTTEVIESKSEAKETEGGVVTVTTKTETTTIKAVATNGDSATNGHHEEPEHKNGDPSVVNGATNGATGAEEEDDIAKLKAAAAAESAVTETAAQ